MEKTVIVLNQRLEVGVCGNSMFLNGMAAGLKVQGMFRVSRLEKTLADALLDIKMLSLDTVLFEYADAERPGIAALLRECPGIRLIGLEAERNALIVFSGHEHVVTNVEDLIQVIANKRVVK